MTGITVGLRLVVVERADGARPRRVDGCHAPVTLGAVSSDAIVLQAVGTRRALRAGGRTRLSLQRRVPACRAPRRVVSSRQTIVALRALLRGR